MNFHKYYSSSRGNLYAVEAASGERLLIDPGVTWRKLQKALDFDLGNIAGCLVSHEHKDHSKAVHDVLNAGIDVFATEGTLKGIDEFLLSHRRIHIIRDKERFGVGETFEVFPFGVHHDAAEPLGFVITENSSNGDGKEENLLFVADTSHVTQRFGTAFDIVAICCSYDKAALKARVDNGDVNETFAKRLLTSHMERAVTLRYVTEFCVMDKCREIYLLHASRDNIHIRGVRKELEEGTFIKTYY
jgi:phosphoribosyl 1,2-cyclic phosphodiesterase